MTKLSKITKTLSTASVTVILLAFIVTVGVLTVSKNRDTLFSPDPSTGDVKTRIVTAFDENIVGFDRFLSVYSTAQHLLGTSVYDDAGYTYLIRDSENNLHFNTVHADAAPYADAVAELNNVLLTENIPFLYIQAPTKEIDGYTKYPLGIDYATVDNAADMVKELTERGVNMIDLSEVFANNGTDPATMFYRTDHHWTTETAFDAFGYVVSYLNENYGLSLDMSLCERENWLSESQPQSFLGSIGRRIGKEAAGLDDYTFLEPNFETSYYVYYPPISEIYPNWAGTFRDAFVREGVLYSEDVNANRYASYFEFDYGHLIIENLLDDNELHIAVVKDSFALPFTAFLSTAAAKIDMIDLREFEGSVTEYLVETSPDIVLMLYSGGSFSDVMYEFDKSK
ncbi:MAG: hypothetical protein IJ428_01135 [Clostridia bacterium]|nr:hypothetical protein [Clostridia bacterium]